jgi:hypothetical protein
MGTSRLEIYSDGSEAVFYFQIHDGTDPAAGALKLLYGIGLQQR